MSASAQPTTPAMEPPSPGDALAALRQSGSAQFDAVAWHFIELLAQRAAVAGPAQRLVQAKLAQALSELGTRFEAAHQLAQQALDQAGTLPPQAAAELKRLMGAGDFAGLHRRLKLLAAGGATAPSALRTLVGDLNQSSSGLKAPATPQAAGAWRPENPRVGQFRNTLSKISVAKQVTHAMTQAPQNAGPINSHMLVLRSLALMRDASPDYLNRFMAYADTLLRLDEAQYSKPAAGKATRAPRPAKR